MTAPHFVTVPGPNGINRIVLEGYVLVAPRPPAPPAEPTPLPPWAPTYFASAERRFSRSAVLAARVVAQRQAMAVDPGRERMRTLRAALGLSQRDLVALIGCSRGGVAAAETRESRCSGIRLCAIALMEQLCRERGLEVVA